MKAYNELSIDELLELKKELLIKFEELKGEGLKLDMSRGKPSVEQMDMCLAILDVINSNSYMKTENGIDVRNYGIMDGIPEAKKLMGDILGVPKENVIVCGNASLNIMYDTVARYMLYGVLGETPWCKLEKVKFLCPVPGYDRHFKITETLGIEMINIPILKDGPDMDMVEALVGKDESIKGIWCVPKYSNPSGVTYSDEVVMRLAKMKTKAKDFRIFWDNAYAIHDIYEDRKDNLLEILSTCEKAGNPDRVLEFASTSKITFAASGISCIASSIRNLDEMRKVMTAQTIGHDKINQLRHVRYLKDLDNVKEIMSKHAAILRPKFKAVLDTFDRELSGLGICKWMNPNGGYFISFDAMDGCAKKIVERCKALGVVLTGAGATFPYGLDPNDSNIRIAPSYPTVSEMEKAAAVFSLCVKLVSIDKILEMK